MRAEVLDLLFVKKMSGHLYLTQGFCNYLTWPLSISSLSASVGTKGKPPIWHGDMKAAGATLWYDDKIYAPGNAWDKKKIVLRMYGKKVKITIKNALPLLPNANYTPVSTQGITILGRDLVFELTQDGGEMGLVEGLGSIGSSKHKQGLCA